MIGRPRDGHAWLDWVAIGAVFYHCAKCLALAIKWCWSSIVAIEEKEWKINTRLPRMIRGMECTFCLPTKWEALGVWDETPKIRPPNRRSLQWYSWSWAYAVYTHSNSVHRRAHFSLERTLLGGPPRLPLSLPALMVAVHVYFRVCFAQARLWKAIRYITVQDWKEFEPPRQSVCSQWFEDKENIPSTSTCCSEEIIMLRMWSTIESPLEISVYHHNLR